ncbi:hypothetical protein VTN77DRAFT_3729 [Rasamsonia byssochlamydoides]|uniref:uncharacterized protein n=1 Tax=Rasamsonia byssochlamydoides TaxID=89139 RepID=UPI0037422E55
MAAQTVSQMEKEFRAHRMQQITDVLGTSVDKFLKQPWKDRKQLYCRALTAKGFLLMIDHEALDEELGPAVLLLHQEDTGSRQLTEEAQRIYLSRNAFQVKGSFVHELLARRRDEAGSFDPKRWVKRLSIILYWEDEEEHRELGNAEHGVVTEILRLLMECDRLRDVAFEIAEHEKKADQLLADLLNATQPSLQELDCRLERGVLIFGGKGGDNIDGSLYGDMIPLPWWDEEKRMIMKEAEKDWERALCATDDEDSDDEDTE